MEARSLKSEVRTEDEPASHFDLLTSSLKGNAFTPVKTANEGIQRLPAKTVRRAGLILLLTEKLGVERAGHRPPLQRPDEHNQTGILTPGLTSLPPSRPCGQWQWEFVARYSGATVADFHRVP